MEQNILNGKARGWAARTDRWKKEQEEKEKAAVAYAKELNQVMYLKKDVTKAVLAKFDMCEKSFYKYMKKWA